MVLLHAAVSSLKYLVWTFAFELEHLQYNLPWTQDGASGIHANILFSTEHFLDTDPDKTYPSKQPYQTEEPIRVDPLFMFTKPFEIVSGVAQSLRKGLEKN